MDNKKRIINVLVAGHSQHGKSSLIHTIVGTFPDNLDYELNHGTTVKLKVIQFHLKEKDIILNFLDSPGHADFKGSIALGLEFTDVLLLVVSGSEGFQARTYWLYEKAKQKGLPIIIAATKMDLKHSNTKRIEQELDKLDGNRKVPIIQTSAKEEFGIEELIDKLTIYIKRREHKHSDLKFLILGYDSRKGIGELINIGILSGIMKSKSFLTEQIRIRQMFSLNGNPLGQAQEGEIIQIALNIDSQLDLGTKYYKGKFFSGKIDSLLSEINPRKEFKIKIENSIKFKTGVEILENLKKISPSFDYYTEKNTFIIQVLGDVQFDFIRANLEKMIDFKIMSSNVKALITIDKKSKGRYKTAKVQIAPRFKKKMTLTRDGSKNTLMHDILGANVAYEAFHLDGLHVNVVSGKNEDDIAQAIAKAIEKVKIIKIYPKQDIIVKVENYHDIYSLIEKYDIEVLYQSLTNSFFLQVKNDRFEEFFASLMKISDGKADIRLFNFDQREKILSIDPGTRHFGFCIIDNSELPSLWYINLKSHIEDTKAKMRAKKQIENELNIFIGGEKALISKIFIGNGPGSDFIIDFLIEYFNIPCENQECIITDYSNLNEKEAIINKKLSESRFDPPDIYLVDEFKTTKEALYHLKKGEIVSEVKSKGFVDHAIAALLIAKRGIKGEVIEIEQKPLKRLYEYVVENYAGSYSFSSIHHLNSLSDITRGMYLRVKDSSKLDSALKDGDIIVFTGFGASYTNIHANTISGNKIIIKFQAGVSARKDFFDVFVPLKQKT